MPLPVRSIPHGPRKSAGALVLLLCLVLAPAALGQSDRRTNAPPGNAGVQEYVESIPQGSGDEVTNDISNSLRSQPPPAGTPEQVKEFAKATTPEGSTPQKPRRVAKEPEGESLPAAIFERTTGSSGEEGMGIGLPIVMVLLLLAAAGYAVSRRSRGHGGQAA